MKTVRLGDLVEIKGGGTPDKSRAEYWNGKIPWASVKDFKSTEICSTVDSITELGVENSATNIIPAGSILVPTRMAVGKAAVNAVAMAINQDLKALTPGPSLDTRYLLYALLANSSLLERQATGATVKGITLEVLRGLQIPFPPLEEQRRIAAILDQADALRRQRREIIAHAQRFKQSMLARTLTMTRPAKECAVRLADLVRPGDKINYGVVQPGSGCAEGIRLVRVANIVSQKFSDDCLKRIDPGIESQYRRSRLHGDEILVACVGSIGAVALATPDLAGANIARAVARIPVDPERVDREYLAEYLKGEACQRYFEAETRAVAQPTLNIKQLNEMPLRLPPKEVQKDFSRAATNLDKTLVLASDALHRLDTLFASLQHRAFNGQL